MEVTVNQQNQNVAEHCSVEQLVQNVLNRTATGVAVAINQTVIPKSNWKTCFLNPGDKVVLITATQGG